MSRRLKMGILLGVDSGIIIIANMLSAIYVKSLFDYSFHEAIKIMLFHLVFYIFFGTIFHVFNRINRYTSLNGMLSIALAATSASLSTFFVTYFMDSSQATDLQMILSYFLSLLVLVSSRVFWRVLVDTHLNKQGKKPPSEKTLIIGAGDGGELLYNTLKNKENQTHLSVVGFVDDDVNKQNTYLAGLKVLGTLDELPRLVQQYEIDVLTVAIPSMTPKEYQRLLDITNELSIRLYSIPSFEELASGKVSVSRLREIDVVDLLGRDEVTLDMNLIKDHITLQTIMVTGAGGSIGSEICRQVMTFSPREILLVGHGENSIYLIEKELRQTFPEKQTIIIPLIGDVQDKERMSQIMATYQPDIIYHAAAHKHVPLMEYNPEEAVKNNILGTKHVAEAALENNVKSFVMISTDKAVNPPNVMGATKRMAEMIVTGLNGRGVTKFSAVRFGNVLGSRGSVVPLFKEQVAKGGPVTVTDTRMTRYFMTIPEASRLVIQAGALARGGEIFILDMGDPVKIVDLAKAVIKLSGFNEYEIDIVESGIRPGEKLYEELLVDKEKAEEQVHEKIFVGKVNGFSYEEVIEKVKQLPKDGQALSKELIAYANLSSEV